MKNVYNMTSKNNPLSGFIKFKKTCLNCKGGINSGAVCKNCKNKVRELFIERKLEVNFYERIYNGTIF